MFIPRCVVTARFGRLSQGRTLAPGDPGGALQLPKDHICPKIESSLFHVCGVLKINLWASCTEGQQLVARDKQTGLNLCLPLVNCQSWSLLLFPLTSRVLPEAWSHRALKTWPLEGSEHHTVGWIGLCAVSLSKWCPFVLDCYIPFKNLAVGLVRAAPRGRGREGSDS